MKNKDWATCAVLWFSGFFGLGTLVHLIRLTFRVPVTVGGWEVPLGVSAVLVALLGLLSAGLLAFGCKRR